MQLAEHLTLTFEKALDLLSYSLTSAYHLSANLQSRRPPWATHSLTLTRIMMMRITSLSRSVATAFGTRRRAVVPPPRRTYATEKFNKVRSIVFKSGLSSHVSPMSKYLV